MACRRRLAPLLLWLSAALGATGCGYLAPESGEPVVRVLCAASLRQPMEELSAKFQAGREVRVELVFGASNTLLGQAAMTHTGDVFLPADSRYVEQGVRIGLCEGAMKLASMKPVLLLAPGVPPIERLADLQRTGLRIALARPETAAIGSIARDALQQAGLWLSIETRVTEQGVFTANVTEAATAVALGSADVAIVWDVVAHLHSELKTSSPVEFGAIRANVTGARFVGASRRTEGEEFLAYLSSAAGQRVFARHGFGPPAESQP